MDFLKVFYKIGLKYLVVQIFNSIAAYWEYLEYFDLFIGQRCPNQQYEKHCSSN